MNVVLRFTITAAFTILFISFTAWAQAESWRNYTFTGEVRSIEDAGPFLWIGTTHGLIKFTKATGERTVFTKANSGMVDNYVKDVAIDSSGRVWCATGYGGTPSAFTVFDGTSWQSYSSPLSSASSIAIGQDGTIWCATTGLGQVYKLVNGKPVFVFTADGSRPNQVDELTLDREGRLWGIFGGNHYIGRMTYGSWDLVMAEQLGIPYRGIHSLDPSSDGTMLVGTVSGLVRYDGTTLTRILPDTSVPLDSMILEVREDRQGRIWVVTLSELGIRTNGTWEVYQLADIGLTERLETMLVDKDGIGWFGTVKGMVRFDGTAARHFETTVNGLPDGSVQTIVFDRQGTAWIGTSEGAARFDGTTWTTFTTDNSGLPGKFVREIAIAPDNSIWFGTNKGIGVYDGSVWRSFTTDNTPLRYGAIEAIGFDRQGNCWVGSGGIETGGNGIARFDGTTWTIFTTEETHLPFNGASAIVADNDNNVWFAMGRHGIAKYDGVSWTAFMEDDSGVKIELPTSIVIDRIGKLTIGSYYSGVFTFDRVDTWEHLEKSPGALASSAVSTVAIDKFDNVWFGFGGSMAVDAGAQRYDGSTWKLYDRWNSALPEGNLYTIAFDSSGGVWFGTREGIGVLNNGVLSSVPLPFSGNNQAIRTSLSVVPNPTTSRTTITYTVAENADRHVRLSLADAMGRTVLTCLDEPQEPGVHRVEIETRGLAPGWYGVSLRSGGTIMTQPVLVTGQ